LNVRPIGTHDNFFDLGGHSLAATRVISRLIQTFRLDLPVKALFDAPTVAQMAAVITKNQVKRASEETLNRMLSEVEAMTEEEAQQQLVEGTSRGTTAVKHE
jgi:surfactin family lipopeptide synthetase C